MQSTDTTPGSKPGKDPILAPQNTDSKPARRAAGSGLLGSAFEYYDFVVFNAAAALIFGRVFFPGSEHGQLLSIATLGVAYIARPLGAVFWGHFGDRIGRKGTLMWCLGTMGAATFLIGCLPAYDAVGVWAPVMLVVLRLIQGFSAGGETPGSSSLTLEHAPDHRRAFFVSFTSCGAGLGVVLATVVFIPLAMLPDEALFSWGWRIAFWLSAAVALVTFFIRRNLDEPEVFKHIKETDKRDVVPLITAVRYHWKTMIRVVVTMLAAAAFPIFTVFSLSYAVEQVGIDRTYMLTVITTAALASSATQPLFGMLADRIGRKPVMGFGTIITGAMMFAYLGSVGAGNTSLIMVTAIGMYAVGFGMFNGCYLAYFPEQFPTKVRLTGLSVSLMVGLLASGFAPVVAQSVSVAFDNAWQPVAAGFLALTLISAVAIWLGPETYRTPTAQLGIKQPNARTDKSDLSASSR